jgi:hypothetical protein
MKNKNKVRNSKDSGGTGNAPSIIARPGVMWIHHPV